MAGHWALKETPRLSEETLPHDAHLTPLEAVSESP
jgi:hypothetical protein